MRWLLCAPVILLPTGCGEADLRGASAQEATEMTAQAASEPSAVQECRVVREGTLPTEVRETSGLARSTRDAALFWTHNDAGNAPELFAVDTAGRLVQRVRVTGAQLVDWEDIDTGPCDGGRCLYIGDIGDNDGERGQVTVYRIPEPAEGAQTTEAASAFHARYPDGPKDAESLFVHPDGTIYVVTKGRDTPVALYRWRPSAAGETVTMERVRELLPAPRNQLDRVTAATISPDGRWVGIRSYRQLFLYRTDDLLGSGGPAATIMLGGQEQGESLVLDDDASAWVTSEAEGGGVPRFARMQCTWPE